MVALFVTKARHHPHIGYRKAHVAECNAANAAFVWMEWGNATMARIYPSEPRMPSAILMCSVYTVTL